MEAVCPSVMQVDFYRATSRSISEDSSIHGSPLGEPQIQHTDLLNIHICFAAAIS
jgi:hypothetical protein